jgi:hypothetical protein
VKDPVERAEAFKGLFELYPKPVEKWQRHDVYSKIGEAYFEVSDWAGVVEWTGKCAAEYDFVYGPGSLHVNDAMRLGIAHFERGEPDDAFKWFDNAFHTRVDKYRHRAFKKYDEKYHAFYCERAGIRLPKPRDPASRPPKPPKVNPLEAALQKVEPLVHTKLQTRLHAKLAKKFSVGSTNDLDMLKHLAESFYWDGQLDAVLELAAASAQAFAFNGRFDTYGLANAPWSLGFRIAKEQGKADLAALFHSKFTQERDWIRPPDYVGAGGEYFGSVLTKKYVTLRQKWAAEDVARGDPLTTRYVSLWYAIMEVLACNDGADPGLEAEMQALLTEHEAFLRSPAYAKELKKHL